MAAVTEQDLDSCLLCGSLRSLDRLLAWQTMTDSAGYYSY